jgi:prepilin-type N-terminal cleavage/methylation domain-containing protein
MPRLNAFSMPARRGFTLTEVMVTLFILSVVGVAIGRVMIKQQQSYRDTSREASMQREMRLATGLLPTELRSTSSAGSDILEMEENKVTFLANIGSSIICQKVGNTHFVIPPLNTAIITTTNWYTAPQPGDSVFLLDDGLLKGAEDDTWARRAIQSWATSTQCAGAPYTDAALDAGKTRYLIGINGVIPDSVRIGAVVRFARPVRYSIYAAPSGSWYLGYEELVNGSWSSVEPVGGPFRPFLAGDANPSGMQLRYYDSLGVRLTSAVDRQRVSRIDVFLRTQAGLAAVTERRPNNLRDSVMMRIAVRNFK